MTLFLKLKDKFFTSEILLAVSSCNVYVCVWDQVSVFMLNACTFHPNPATFQTYT